MALPAKALEGRGREATMPASQWWLVCWLAAAASSIIAPESTFRPAWGLELSITYPLNFSCVVPGISVQVEVGLETHDRVDDFLSNLNASSLCLHLDDNEEDEGDGRASPHRLCSHGPSASLSLPPLRNGCHTMRAELLQRDTHTFKPLGKNVTTAISAPVYFQVTQSVGALCTELHGCAPPQASGLEQQQPQGGQCSTGEEEDHMVQLVIDSPRTGDRVYGTSALLSMSLSTRNGTRMDRKGQLCLQYKVYPEHSSSEGEAGGDMVEECLGVSEDSYDGGSLEVPIQVHPPDGAMEWGTSVGEKRGITLDLTAAFHLEDMSAQASSALVTAQKGVTFTLEPLKQRAIEEVILSQARLEALPGLLPSLPLVLLVSHYEEDLDWLSHQPHPAIVYEKKSPRDLSEKHFVPVNVAGEATAYLKFIVDYYHQLPHRMIFLHGHRVSYHQEDILLSLRLLEDRLEGLDYCNINRVVWGCKEDPERRYLTRHWEEWLGSWLGPLPPVLLDRCCAQFVVHRDRIHRLPHAFFKEALASKFTSATMMLWVAIVMSERLYRVDRQSESRKAGLLLEWLWHYLFGQESVGERALEPLIPLLPQVDRLSLATRAPCFLTQPPQKERD